MAGFLTILSDILFPPRCAFCRRHLKIGQGLPVCPSCLASLELRDHTLIGVPATEGCMACLRYEGKVREAVLRFKFGGCSGYASLFGHILAGAIGKNLNGQYYVITWVPVSARRKQTRGYDQAMLIAMAAAMELGGVAVSSLEKTLDVPSQTGLHEHERRRANVLGAFRVPDPELIADKRVLLIDDTVTSGATLSECAATLRIAGAQSVLCAVLADASHRL